MCRETHRWTYLSHHHRADWEVQHSHLQRFWKIEIAESCSGYSIQFGNSQVQTDANAWWESHQLYHNNFVNNWNFWRPNSNGLYRHNRWFVPRTTNIKLCCYGQEVVDAIDRPSQNKGRLKGDHKEYQTVNKHDLELRLHSLHPSS